MADCLAGVEALADTLARLADASEVSTGSTAGGGSGAEVSTGSTAGGGPGAEGSAGADSSEDRT
jgi:hypothetical protein